MYRQSSFSSKTVTASSAAEVDETSVDGDHVIYLKSTGKFLNRNTPQLEGGLLAVFRNHTVRNKLWALTTVCCNLKTGGFVVADERGQVYKMSAVNNLYNSIRLASTGVAAMCFINQHKNHLVIAYESGAIVVVDTHTKDIIGNLQIKAKTVARLIQSHPSELKVAIASDDKTVAIWDLNTCQCVQSMQCEEPIVDIRYELSGRIITVVLEHTGVYMYATDPSSELRVHLKLPSSEESPKWTAYCAYNVYMDVQGPSRPRPALQDPAALNVLLGSHTSLLYSWHVSVADLLRPRSEQGNSGMKVGSQVVPPFHLVGVVELPLKNRVAVSLQLLNPNASNSGTLSASANSALSPTKQHTFGAVSHNSSGTGNSAGTELPPRVLVTTQQGGMLVVDVEGFQVRSAGFFSVKADLDAQLVHGADATAATGWLAQTVGSRRSAVAVGTPSTASQSVYGKVHTTKNFIVAVGCDGMVRLFDLRGALGSGALCGTVLRSRVPRIARADAAPVDVSGGASHRYLNSTTSTRTMARETAAAHANHTHPPASTRTGAASRGSLMQSSPERLQTFTDAGPPPCSPHSPTTSATADASHDFILQDSRDADDQDSPVQRVHRRNSTATSFRAAASVKAGSAGTFGTFGVTAGRTAPPRAASVASSRIGARSAIQKDRQGGRVMQSFVATHKSRKQAQQDTSHLPLFELAALTPKESQVNTRKLRNFLELNGEFPARYRPLVWRFLLKLPENSSAFSELVNRGVHASFENLYDKYPIQNRKIFDRLQHLCSQLAHWAPILAEAPYLPALVFPFTLVFNADELAALETSMAVMMWWGHSWHATHPNPPVHIVDALDALLKFHDSKLYNHFKALKSSPGLMGWAMLSSLFTELLSRTNWLKLMDTLFCHFEQISVILLAPIALMKELKGALLTCDSASQVALLLRTQQSVNMLSVTKHLLEWLRSTPPKFFTAIATRHLDGVRLELGPGRVTDELQLSEVDQAGENLAFSSGRPVFPLTKGRYPVYDGYPAHILDLQIRERDKILALGKEISRRESVLTALQQKLAEVETDHASWMSRHKSASDAERQHQTEMMVREREHLAELQRIEEEISRQRLATLTSLETAARDEMDLMDQATRESQRLLEEGEAHMKEKISIQLNLQKHRELAEMAEVATHDRIRQLKLSRIREDWVKNIADTVKSREEEFTVRDTIMQEQWQKEDDRQRLLRAQRLQQLKAQEEDARREAMQEDIAVRMQRLQMERDAKVVEVERVRALRLAKEQADEALEAAERSSMALRKTEMLSAKEQSALLSEQTVRHAEAKLLETVDMIKAESTKLLEAERVHTLRQNKARIQARQAQLREEWAEKSGKQLHGVISAQGELQAQMLRLQQAAMRTELDRDVAYSTGSVTASGQFEEARRHLESMEESVLAQQRQRFEEMQEYLRSQHRQSTTQGLDQRRPSTAAGAPGSPEGGEPGWDFPPSAIPAPLSGAGIGYGVRPPAPPRQMARVSRQEQAAELSDIEKEAKTFKIPLDKALKVAGAALKAQQEDWSEDEEQEYLGDDYAARPSAWRRHDLPPTSGLGVSGGVTASSLQQDALDIAAAAGAYSFDRAGHTKQQQSSSSKEEGQQRATTRTASTATSARFSQSTSNADSLRQLAEQSLRNLQATRVMNRDEVTQERQEHSAYQQSPSVLSTPGTAVSVGGPAPDSADHVVARRPGLSVDVPSAAPEQPLSSPTHSSGSSKHGGVVADTDTALWAMDADSDEDLY